MSSDIQSLVQILAKGSGTKSNEELERQKQALDYISKAGGDFQNTLLKAEGEREEERKMEEEKKELVASLGDNGFLLSSIAGMPKSKKDRIFKPFKDTDWPEEVRCDIPEIDPMYKWDPDLLEALWLAYNLDEKALLVGPPGTGKTTAVKQFAALMRQPFGRFNGKDGIEVSSILGGIWATSKGMEWKDGMLPQCCVHGYITCIDEIMKMPPGIQMAMQSLYEKGGFLMLDDKPGTIKDKHVYPSASFRLICTDNTKGTGDNIDKYAAGQMQDVSTLDRFGITMNVGYLPRKDEIEMLITRFPQGEEKHIKRIVSFADLVRTAFMQGNLAVTLSPRGLQVIMSLVASGLDLDSSIRLTYINKLGDDREIEVATRLLKEAA
jgi:MoxR-like ATPase